MREIKFRAWDNILKYWLVTDDMPILSDGSDKSMFLEFESSDEIIFMQYTGLKKIYEGDIVNVTFPNGGRVRAEIRWQYLSWQYYIHFALDESYNSQPLASDPYPHYSDLYCAHYTFEIIGNIFQNPELLESK